MVNARAPRPYARYAWTLLFAFWALHLVLSMRDFFPSLQDLCLACVPGAQTAIQSSTGMTWSQLTSTNPRFASFLATTLVDDGISGVGLAIFGMIVSLTDFRRGEKWAWYVSWSMPIGIMAAQLNVYLLTGSLLVIVLGLVFVLVSMLALFLPYRQFFPKRMTRIPRNCARALERQPYPLINGVSGLPLPPASSGPPFPQQGARAQW